MLSASKFHGQLQHLLLHCLLRLFGFEERSISTGGDLEGLTIYIDNDLTNTSPSESCLMTRRHLGCHLYLHLACSFGTNYTFTLPSCSKSTLHIYFYSKPNMAYHRATQIMRLFLLTQNATYYIYHAQKFNHLAPLVSSSQRVDQRNFVCSRAQNYI